MLRASGALPSAVASIVLPRRRQNPPRAPDASRTPSTGCENLSGRNYEPADSGIGDFRRAPVRIPRARGTARTFSLACTDWVGSQYYWGVHTCAKKFQSFSVSLGMKRLCRFAATTTFDPWPEPPIPFAASTTTALDVDADAARWRRASSGGPIGDFRRAPVRIPRLEAPLAQKLLHALIGSPSTIYEKGGLATRFPGRSGRSHLAAVASVVHPRRRQNPPRAPDASRTPSAG